MVPFASTTPGGNATADQTTRLRVTCLKPAGNGSWDWADQPQRGIPWQRVRRGVANLKMKDPNSCWWPWFGRFLLVDTSWNHSFGVFTWGNEGGVFKPICRSNLVQRLKTQESPASHYKRVYPPQLAKFLSEPQILLVVRYLVQSVTFPFRTGFLRAAGLEPPFFESTVSENAWEGLIHPNSENFPGPARKLSNLLC